MSNVIERSVGLIAVGINNVESLTKLKGAAAGAKAIADWLVKQQTTFGINPIIHLFTDEDGEVIKYEDIKITTQQLVDDGGLDLLILYFSSHGVVKNGDDEQILLSRAQSLPSEAVNIPATIRHARYSNIPHVIIISDACRDAVDPFGPLGTVNGSPVFVRRSVVVKQSQVDCFFATVPSQTAKELRGDGFFTKILLEALNNSPDKICDKHPNTDKPVIKAWDLGTYLQEQVPILAFKETPSFEQIPEISTESRDPCFFGYANKPNIVPKLKYIGLELQSNLSPNVLGFQVDKDKWITKNNNAETSSEKASVAFLERIKNQNEAFNKILISLNSERRVKIPSSLLEEAGISKKVNEYLEIEKKTEWVIKDNPQFKTGYYIIGEEVEEVIAASGLDLHIKKIGHKEILIESNFNITFKNDSILVIFKTGTFTILPLFKNYIGTVHVGNGLVKSISLTLYKKRQRQYDFNIPEILSLRRACAAAFASTGKLSILGKVNNNELYNFADFIRYDKHIDPTLGIYAAYAYALAGNQKEVESIYHYFMAYKTDPLKSEYVVPFDVAFLADIRLSKLSFSPVLFCPLMSLGWSLLDTYIDRDLINPLILDLGKNRLNSEWSTFEVKHNKEFIRAFLKGEI